MLQTNYVYTCLLCPDSMLFCFNFIPDNIVMSDPVFRQDDRYFLSTEEAFDRAMEKSVRYVRVCKEMGITDNVEKNLFKK